MEGVKFKDGILYVNGKAYVDLDNLSLIKRVIAPADNIYSTRIILTNYDNSKIYNELQGKYWVRAYDYDLIKHKSYRINQTAQVAGL